MNNEEIVKPWERGRLARKLLKNAGWKPAFPAKPEVLQFPRIDIHNTRGAVSTMNDIANRIAQRATETNVTEINWNNCFQAERIPGFYRGETDAETTRRILEHLEVCEECNLLLMALTIQSPPKAGVDWVKNGVRLALRRVISLRDIMTAGDGAFLTPQPAMRGINDDYCLSEKKIPLPDGNELCISVVGIQSHKRILTAHMSNGTRRRYDLYERNGEILKSIDNARQIKIVMPDEGVVLVIDDRFEIKLGNDSDTPESRPS